MSGQSLLPPQARPAPGEGKLQQVQRLIDVLDADLSERTLSATQRAAALEQLKIFGRDENQSDPIFTEKGIEVLCKHGFESDNTPSTKDALRCLANALLLVPKTRTFFVRLGFAQKAAARFPGESVDDEFILARLLFLSTYEATLDLKELIEQYNFEASISNALSRHAELYSDKYSEKARDPSAMEDMALSETLKLVFNVSHFSKERPEVLSKSVGDIAKILRKHKLSTPPLQPPITHLINALLGIDLDSSQGELFPGSDPICNVAKLLEILDKSTDKKFTGLKADVHEQFDELGTPLITLLRKLLEIAPEEVKTYMRSRILPSDDERKQPLGQGYSLSARMLKLSSSATAPKTRETISYLLFELSNQDADEFVRNIGYGYASGFLMTHNIPIPERTLDPDAQSTSARPVNPITGQTLESEPEVADPFAGMSEEEKEREAERLFVLFERHGNFPFPSLSLRRLMKAIWTNMRPRNRLKKTGIVDVKNPVQQAVDEGRFEELD